LATDDTQLTRISNEVIRMLDRLALQLSNTYDRYDMPHPQELNKIETLNSCIEELSNILRDSGEIPMVLDEPLATVPGEEDKVEIAIKLAYVIELANRIAKLPIMTNAGEISRKFYAVKDRGIDALSRFQSGREHIYKGSSDYDTRKQRMTYSLQIGEYSRNPENYGVVSWHLRLDQSGTSNARLRRENYRGIDVIAYNGEHGYELRGGRGNEGGYNEEGFAAFNKLLTQRRNDKPKIIKGKIIDRLKKVYGEEGIDEKISWVNANSFGKTLEEQVENSELLTRILTSLKFGEGMEFELLDEKVAGKIIPTMTYKEEMYVGNLTEVYNMLEILEAGSGCDFQDGIEIIKSISELGGENELELSVAKELVQNLAQTFATTTFESQGKIEPAEALEMAVADIRERIKSKEMELNALKSPEKMKTLLTQIKKNIENRAKEMLDEKTEDRISIDEVLDLIDEKQCDEREILQVADELLAFAYRRDKSRVPNTSKGEIVEHVTDNLSTRGILDLRRKMKEEGYIGGGRY